MGKLKTNKAAKKRYSLTATGKVKRTKSNRRHLLANKTKRQKKSGKVQNAYASKTCENTIKKLYHMVVNIIIKIKEIKEGEIKWRE